MSWLLPSALAIGGIAAVVTVALHFIARSRPLAEPLPTARFIPQRPIHARTRSIALTDSTLLLVRVAALLVLAAAIAAPVFAAARNRVARVVVADRSRDVANIQEVRDTVRAVLRAGDVLVAFDSDAVTTALDSLKQVDTRGSLSAGLASAVRAGAALAPRADSVELIIVSALTAAEIDDATPRIRATWPGRARIVRVASTPATSAVPPRVTTSATTDDPVVAGLALLGVTGTGRVGSAEVRLVRGRVSVADSAWARDAGHVLIHWPADDDNALWPKRNSIDAIGAVASSGGVMVGRFPRLWVLSGRTVARWADGEPAAVEHATGAGCIRDVGVVFDPAGDATLRPAFRELVQPFLEPCGGATATAPLGADGLKALAGEGPLAAGDALRDRSSETSRWTPWLLFAGAGLLILELAMRRSSRTPA